MLQFPFPFILKYYMGWTIRLSYLPILSYLKGLILSLDDFISVWPCGHYYKIQGLTHVVHMFYTE